MTVTRYFKMLWVYVGLVAAVFLLGVIESISEIAHGSPPARPLSNELAWGVLLMGLTIAYVIALVGLFGFKHWSRPLALTVTALGIVANLFLPPSLSSGIESVLSDTISTLWGAILAVSYFSAISARFEPPLAHRSVVEAFPLTNDEDRSTG